ncbi:MAG: DNA replication/repair protein RecF [Cytophagaceae bacterium]
MYLEKLNLLNFKNYQEANLSFSPGINIISGPNGSGKTNIIDAIHYLSLTKSAFNSQDALSIKDGEEYFIVNGVFKINNKKNRVSCSLKTGQKKLIQVDKSPYDKASEHIGRFPVVIITPYDTDIVREGSEERRKFLDTIFSQTNPQYLSSLIKYNQVLKQRNSLLKMEETRRRPEKTLFEIYDEQLIELGKIIFSIRNQEIQKFLPIFHETYNRISDKKEEVGINYESQLFPKNYPDLFRKSFEQDLMLQRTRMGIHKDDLIFTIHDKPLKNFGSQGQQKTFVTALKLSQFVLIKEIKELNPLLLLDDIFDKLDEFRIERLLQMVSEKNFGQIFITDARIERSKDLFENISPDIRIFNVVKGNIEAIE